MAFELKQVVPWGRSLAEYRDMFRLTDRELHGAQIAGFGDGPASFNCECTRMGGQVTSFDPLYSLTPEEIGRQLDASRAVILEQARGNLEHYRWDRFLSLEELAKERASVMRLFLEDFEQGRREGRYVAHRLPASVGRDAGCFDLGLSSHFLFLYTQMGYEFHVAALTEMLRVCKEVRVFPLLDLDAQKSDLASRVISHLTKAYAVEIVKSDYEFLKGADQMLVIKHFH